MKIQPVLVFICFLLSFQPSSAQCIGGDCKWGMGTFLWDSGDEYTGQWVNGNRTGLGVYDWADGSYYYGYFKEGKLEGKGVYLAKDKANDLIGTFHDGSLSSSGGIGSSGCILGDCTDGVGVYLWDTDDIYMGEWQGGVRTGYGRYDWADGSFYTGFFKDGKLDGQGEYISADDKKMSGLFINNEFQGTTEDLSSKSSSSAPSFSNSETVTESDFCSVIQAVVRDYPNNFNSLKGKMQPADELDFGDSWNANMKVKGTTEAIISEGFLSDRNSWHTVLYESSSYSGARAVYDDYINQMKDCTTGCCTMLTDKSDYKGSNYESYLTYWLTFLVKDGFSDTYENMTIEIELAKQIFGEGWDVVARVKELKK